MLGEGHPDTATSLSNMAGLLEARGDYAGARPLYQQALAIHERALGKEHTDTDIARSLSELAELLKKQGDYAAAEPRSRRALAIRERALGRSTPTPPPA